MASGAGSCDESGSLTNLRLLIDEMWSPAVAEQLRAKGFDVESVIEREDLKSTSDSNLLVRATVERRAVVTENVDDFRVLAEVELMSGRSHAGIIYTTRNSFHRGHSRSVGRLISALQSLLESDLELTDRELWLQPLTR
jgi:hypothetical protein